MAAGTKTRWQLHHMTSQTKTSQWLLLTVDFFNPNTTENISISYGNGSFYICDQVALNAAQTVCYLKKP